MTQNPTMTTRELRGLEMAKRIGRSNEPDVSIQRLNKLTYNVKSQTDAAKWYTVVKQYAKTFGENMREGEWTCDCPDHTFRKVICKHIHAVLFSKLLRKKVYQDTFQTPINQDIIEANKIGKIVCQRCASVNYQKFGIRKNKKNEELQRYRCRDCGFVYIVNPAFENAKATASTIARSIDLYMKGVSLRKIADFLLSDGVEVNYSSISRWVRRFNRIVQPYVDSFVPAQVGGVYHVDEMLLHVRKEKNEMNMTLENKENHTNRKFDNHYSWLWNLCDSSTRFWICSKISQKRRTVDAQAVFAEMKQRAPLPKAIVHDGLPAYDEAYQRELATISNPKIRNVRSVSATGSSSFQSKVERHNGTVRDRECVMRGMDNAKAAQELVDAMRTHFNFIRPNQAIGGQTPAEAAGINLNLGEQNRTENLMRKAAIHAKDVQAEPLVKGLGIRINKVQVLNEKDCIKIKAKTWLDKKAWREIHDILRVQGFNWLSNGKDSCWIKPQN